MSICSNNISSLTIFFSGGYRHNWTLILSERSQILKRSSSIIYWWRSCNSVIAYISNQDLFMWKYHLSTNRRNFSGDFLINMNKISSRYFHQKLFLIYICIPCHLEIVKKSFSRTCRKLRVSIKIRLGDVRSEEH